MAAMQQPLSKTTDGRPPLSTLRVDKSLEGKAVIITGGTSGLGRCIAIACARAGARGDGGSEPLAGLAFQEP